MGSVSFFLSYSSFDPLVSEFVQATAKLIEMISETAFKLPVAAPRQ
jgi:hypothetical protein